MMPEPTKTETQVVSHAKSRSSDPRSIQVQAALLHTAERLFAQRGIDSVSLREIATASGSRNNNVVQYHFGSKDDLLVAIFQHRVEQMEKRRGDMLDIARAAGKIDDPGTLLEIVCLPHLDLTDENGQHPYPAFLLQYTRRSWRVNDRQDWTRGGEIGANLHTVTNALADALAPLPRDRARTRAQLCTLMFLDALIRWDQLQPDQRADYTIFVVDTLRAAKAALTVGSGVEHTDAQPFLGLFPAIDAFR